MTALWANSTTVRRPLDKMKPKDWFRQFFLFILFYYFLFFLRTQVARNKTSGHTVTKYPPVTPLWANSTTVRRPLDKMKPKDWFRQFFPFYFILLFSFFFRLKLRGTRHLATWLQRPHFGPTVQPLGDPWTMKPKDWFRQFFLFYFIFGLKLRGTRHLAFMVIKNPPVVPL